MAEQILSEIRMYEPNDPYYYEVDNLPLEYLLENQKRLQGQIDEFPSFELVATKQWVEDNFVSILDYNTRALSDISDVVFDTPPKEGDILTYRNGNWVAETDRSIATLDQVNITNPTEGQGLYSVNGNWKNQDFPGDVHYLTDMTDYTSPLPPASNVVPYWSSTTSKWEGRESYISEETITLANNMPRPLTAVSRLLSVDEAENTLLPRSEYDRVRGIVDDLMQFENQSTFSTANPPPAITALNFGGSRIHRIKIPIEGLNFNSVVQDRIIHLTELPSVNAVGGTSELTTTNHTGVDSEGNTIKGDYMNEIHAIAARMHNPSQSRLENPTVQVYPLSSQTPSKYMVYMLDINWPPVFVPDMSAPMVIIGVYNA